MKKILLFITLAVYFLVSTGFVVSVHYCMDRMHSFDLGKTERNTCGACGMPILDNKGCCKDEVKVVKLQVDQVTAENATTVLQIPDAGSTFYSSLFIANQEVEHTTQAISHSPPLCRQNRYLYNCVFRL